MSQCPGDLTTSDDSTAPTTVTPTDTTMAPRSGWLLSPGALIATFLSLLSVVIFFHPDLHRLLVLSDNTGEPSLVYVRNFYIWTKYNPKEHNQLKVGSHLSLQPQRFYPRKTYMIIHGFLGSGMDNWILRMKDALLSREDCNVISVNWSAGSSTTEYYFINKRLPDVGKDVARLIRFLQEHGGLSLDQVHVIGHSLGAHAAGFVGKNFNGTMKRITGLDPAGLSFHSSEGTVRLDKSDAEFVDVIHTHGCTAVFNKWGDCYGIDENLGHADFWPNGGESQPACKEGGDGASSVKDGSSCDHGMAYVLYTESIKYPTSNTYFLARRCASWDLYNDGLCQCSDTAQYMGYNANKWTHGTFYLNTSITAPYAQLDPGCSAGSFSTLQILGLVMLALALVVLAILVSVALVHVYMGVPVATAFSFRRRTWFAHSESTKILSATSETHIVT